MIKLTNRQIEILDKRSQGITFKEIAYDLGVSIKTVEFHWAKLKQKLNANRRNKLQDVVAICRWWWARLN